MKGDLLTVNNLSIQYRVDEGAVRAVEDISFVVNRTEKVALVGETGCGKSTAALAIMRLLPPNARVTHGEILLEDRNILEMSHEELCDIRGKRIAMVFQDPYTALNPLLNVGTQNAEPYQAHEKMGLKQALKEASAMLRMVKISNPDEGLKRYPHTFSGGMRQRILIAMMDSLKPDLLIADEPFSSLDVTTQADVMKVLSELIDQYKSALLVITHDLGVVAEMCDKVIVMYAGSHAESGDVATIFKNPRHPYTIGLLGSIPRLDVDVETLSSLAGAPPNLINAPPGCRFYDRCAFRMEKCKKQAPAVTESEKGHLVSCYFCGD